MATPVSKGLTQSAKQPWMDCQTVHQIHVYMGDDQKSIQWYQTRDNITIGTLNHKVIKDNDTDLQENPVNNINPSEHIWLDIEKWRLIAIITEESLKGYGFTERLNKRWDEEFPDKTNYSAKGLHNNASIFKIERKGSKDKEAEA